MKIAPAYQLAETLPNDSLVELIRHFGYSIKDIKSYDELTEAEKKIISREVFNLVTVSDDMVCDKVSK